MLVFEALLLSLALALSLLVAADGAALPGDLWLARQSQDLPGFMSIARFMRFSTGTEGVLIIGAAAAVALGMADRRREGLTLAVTLLALRVLQPAIKDLVDRERPSADLVERRAGFGSESFPSGHMMSATVLCGVLATVVWTCPLPRAVKILAWATLGLVLLLNGASSLYMGLHWPSDLTGGALWGLAIAVPAAAVLLLRPAEQD